MQKRFVCLLLVVILTLPVLLASCSSETDLVDVAAPVYTLYCITGENTTKDAIVRVEYEINRTLFYRIGSIVKLEFVTKDEYDELIEAKKQEVKDYLADFDESGKKNSLVNTAKLSESAEANGYTAMSGEAIIQDLQDGIDIELECPRLDLFLVTDYQSYLEMAENDELTALDTVMSNEAKAIKSYVHTSFFNAAKVGNKTFGVPCNTIIGEYTYVVFNKEILESIMEIAPGIKQETLYDLEDLGDYLALVKENYPEVIPLANTVTPSDFSFMFEDGFNTYVNKAGYVRSTYEDDEINKFFTLLACYQALGYFEDASGNTGTDAPSAVEFFRGTEEEIKEYAEKNNCLYNKYSNPIATSENSIDCIYCVSALCPSSWVTGVMEILTELYTDDSLQNTFLYGIDQVTYYLEDDPNSHIPQVVHKPTMEDGKTYCYEMNYAHTGNCFIAYTDKDAGDSPDKWEKAREQNKDAEESKTIGFTFSPEEFQFGTVIEDGEEVPRIVAEPNYSEIIWNVAKPYYEKLIAGEAVEFDYQAEYEAAEQVALENIRTSLEETYVKRLQAEFTRNIKEEVTAEKGETFMNMAIENCKNDVMDKASTSSYKKKLRNWITEALTEEFPDYSEEQIDEMVEEKMADKEYVWENYRYELIPSIDEGIQSDYNDLFDDEVSARTEKVLESAEYKRAYNEMINSEEFKEELDYSIEVYVADEVNEALDQAISELIKEFCKEMIAECETALTEAVEAFVKEYVEASAVYYEEAVTAEIKIAAPDLAKPENEDKLKARIRTQLEFNENFAGSTSDTKREAAMKDLIAKDYPDMDEDSAKEILSQMIKEFEEIYIPLYSDFYNAEALAYYKIGFTDRSKIVPFGDETEEEETEESEESEESGEDTPVNPDDDPTPDEDGKLYGSYYEFVIAAKLRAPYYEQFGAPQ